MMMLARYRPTFALGVVATVFAGWLISRPSVAQGSGARRALFEAWCWSPAARADKNLYPMVWVRHSNYADPGKIAAEASRLPHGRVALFMWNAASSLLKGSLDASRTAAGRPTQYPSPWLDQGAAQISAKMTRFFREYKAAGGRLNYLVLDYEAGLGSWSMSKANLLAISADPRSAALKKKLGFSNLLSVGTSAGGPCSERCRRIWNEMMGHIVATALNHAIYRPARKIFSRLRAGNYDNVIMLGLIAPDENGYYQPLDTIFGNVQNPSYYNRIAWGLRGWLATQETGGHGPFATLRYELLNLEAIQRGAHPPIVPWISYKSYVKNNPYYRELIYQLAMRGVNHFLYWNPRAWLKGQILTTTHDNTVLNNCLTVLNKKLGSTPGKALGTGAITWNTALLVAARTTSTGRILYRVTVPPGTKAIGIHPGRRPVATNGKTGVWVMSSADRPLTFTVSH